MTDLTKAETRVLTAMLGGAASAKDLGARVSMMASLEDRGFVRQLDPACAVPANLVRYRLTDDGHGAATYENGGTW